jgi:hypothetical protein
MYLEEQWLEYEEEKSLAPEAEEKRRHETPGTWEHYKARQEEANRRAREAYAGGTTSEMWPPPRSAPGIFAPSFFQNLTIHCNNCLKVSHGCICYFLPVVVSIDEHDIDSIEGFAKTMPELHLKPDGKESECYYGDLCKMQVSGDYKTLWQQFWMCNNLAYDLEPDDMGVHMCSTTDCVVQSHLKYLMSFKKC